MCWNCFESKTHCVPGWTGVWSTATGESLTRIQFPYVGGRNVMLLRQVIDMCAYTAPSLVGLAWIGCRATATNITETRESVQIRDFFLFFYSVPRSTWPAVFDRKRPATVQLDNVRILEREYRVLTSLLPLEMQLVTCDGSRVRESVCKIERKQDDFHTLFTVFCQFDGIACSKRPTSSID